MSTIIFMLVAAAFVAWVLWLPESPEDIVLNRIQNGETGAALFTDIPDEIVMDFTGCEHPEEVRRAAREVLRQRGC